MTAWWLRTGAPETRSQARPLSLAGARWLCLEWKIRVSHDGRPHGACIIQAVNRTILFVSINNGCLSKAASTSLLA